MTDDLHNFFFYANTCHVCKSSGNESPIRKCSNCKMISYCSKEHQKQHWLQHKNICRVLSEMLDEHDKSNLLEGMRNVSMEEWVKAKMNLMLMVSLKLKRKLLPYEEEMFKFPKACVVCHEVNSKSMTDCQMCPCASFCEEHQNDPGHSKICDMLNLCYDLDIASTVFIRNPPRNVVPYHTEMAYLPTSINGFIDLYVNEDKSALVSSDIQKPHISEYLTRSLTLLHAMERLEYTTGSEMTLHIIGANMIEVDGIELWETLLHWLPSLTKLNLVLVGPELDSNNEKTECNICDCCVEKGMKLYLETHGILYKDYVNSDSFVKPDIIVGYNLGIHECENIDSDMDSWSQSIRILPEQKCPFVLTSYTSEEAEKEHKRLCDILQRKVTWLCYEKNPYSSLRPHRDYETEGVYYQNQYIIIYRDLD
ncbi:hypothetical protein TSAR_010272 [Trichomalopsis sarcophagae]|uniref:MYND-type domain-containing protein n=1 Tax=Trichomalopsis sarcophagae TaxID=543379 RepID=A0A232EHN5_9HYME|nr:hypothetical protein TSAR_010272 [Trichomalopsis sarcophagae]